MMPKINNQVLRNTITAQKLEIDQLRAELDRVTEFHQDAHAIALRNEAEVDSLRLSLIEIQGELQLRNDLLVKQATQNKVLREALEELDAFCETGYSDGKVLVSYCSDPVMGKVLSAIKETATGCKPLDENTKKILQDKMWTKDDLEARAEKAEDQNKVLREACEKERIRHRKLCHSLDCFGEEPHRDCTCEPVMYECECFTCQAIQSPLPTV